MSRTVVLVALLIAAIALGLTQRGPDEGPVTTVTGAEESPAVVRVAGVMVNKPVAKQDETFPELAFFGTFDRTSVALKLDRPAGGIVELMREDSTLEVFADDRGTDLTEEDDGFGPFDMNARVSEDRRSVVFVAGTELLPHPSAARLRLQGEAALLVANDKTVVTADPIDLAEGARTTVGAWSFEVDSAGPSEWSEGWSLTLSTHDDPTAIVRWSLVREDGSEVPLQPSSSFWGQGHWSQTLEAEEACERASLRLEHWVEPEVVRVPFEVELGLGLGR